MHVLLLLIYLLWCPRLPPHTQFTMADKCIISFANSTERLSYTLATYLFGSPQYTHNTHHLFNFILSLCTSRHCISCGGARRLWLILRVLVFYASLIFIRTIQTLGAALLFIRARLAPRRVICICLICMLMFCSLSRSPPRKGFGFIALIDSINPGRSAIWSTI